MHALCRTPFIAVRERACRCDLEKDQKNREILCQGGRNPPRPERADPPFSPGDRTLRLPLSHVHMAG